MRNDADDAGGGAGMDTLSPLVHRLLKADQPAAYTRLVVRGGGDEEARAVLEMLQPDQLLAVPVRNETAARGMLAGLWLWHDWLDESHRISQDLHDRTGSLWHAIMHRREGDFSNSKYWYRKVGRHPALAPIGVAVGGAINPLPADKSLLRVLREGWDPFAFVDLVEDVSARAGDPRAAVVGEMQRVEWRILFGYCVREAANEK
jgi:hypothetical protein